MHPSKTRRNIWTGFWTLQLIGTFDVTTGVNYFAVACKICLLPGYLVGYGLLRTYPSVSMWWPWTGLGWWSLFQSTRRVVISTAAGKHINLEVGRLLA
jgi:hypothetical protein